MCKVLRVPRCRRNVSTYLAGRRDALVLVSRRKVTGFGLYQEVGMVFFRVHRVNHSYRFTVRQL